MVGDGGIFTSIEDWLLWDQNLSSGTVGGDAWVQQMHQRGVLTSGDTIPYAFGLVHGDHRGLATVSHGGAWVGFRAAMARYPSEDRSFVALCNRADANPVQLLLGVAEVYLEDQMAPEADEPGQEAPTGGGDSAPEGNPVVATPTAYAGAYYSPELDVTYYLTATEEGGIQLRAGRIRNETLSEDAPGVLKGWNGALTLRFSGLSSGAYQQMTADAGRVQNLAFSRE